MLTEVVDALSRPADRSHAVAFVRTQQNDPAVVIISADHTLFELGLDLFSRRLDKDWSLTDCISFVVVRRHKLTDALTADRHFEQAGFKVLL